jgi:hypothetical protein
LPEFFIPEKQKKRKLNLAAVVAAVFIIISGFLFQLFNFEFLGKQWQIEEAVMFNLVRELPDLELPGSLETVVLFMVVLYFASLSLYIINGVGVLSDKYSVLASFLTFIYLLLGIYFVPTFNAAAAIPLIGSVGTASLGLGTYLIPTIAILYLLFKKPLNSLVSS